MPAPTWYSVARVTSPFSMREALAVVPPMSIGIGGHLAVPPLPHNRAYGSRTRRFDRVKLGQEHGGGGDRGRRNTDCAAPVGRPDVLTCARTRSASRQQPPPGTSARHGAAIP